MPNANPRRDERGFSLLELLTTIAVVIILAALLVSVVPAMRGRAQRVNCTANLRTLYVATEAYIQQNGSWPQIPIPDDDSDAADAQYAREWIATLRPFGPSEKSWICPTIQNLMGNPDYMKPENARIDYTPMPFDDKPIKPHQWPKQPWFAENGDVHGNGNLVILTDGSVSDVNTLAAKVSPAPSR